MVRASTDLNLSTSKNGVKNEIKIKKSREFDTLTWGYFGVGNRICDIRNKTLDTIIADSVYFNKDLE